MSVGPGQFVVSERQDTRTAESCVTRRSDRSSFFTRFIDFFTLSSPKKLAHLG